MRSIRIIIAVFSALVMTLTVTAVVSFADEDLTLDIVSGKNIDMPARNELLMSFVEKHASAEAGGTAALKSNSRGSRLKGNDAEVYRIVRDAAEDIAAGDRKSSVIRIPVRELTGGKLIFTAEDLGVSAIAHDERLTQEANAAYQALLTFDENKVLDALLADCPYEFYWFDKTKGFDAMGPAATLNYDGKEWTIRFDSDAAWNMDLYVSRDYSKTGSEKTTDINTSKTSSASSAADTAGGIVRQYASKTDLEKLTAYKDEICSRTGYNRAAASGSVEFGDPWQLIYVFDGDGTTDVVCEGYAKAFQFLCDLTTFKSSQIWSMLVTGEMTGGLGAGRHMWNVVHMDDDRNYLVDVTNCDTANLGYPDLLFLKGYDSGTLRAGYTYKCNRDSIEYVYDENTFRLYDQGELDLADTEYVEVKDPDDPTDPECKHPWTMMETVELKKATDRSEGNEEYWICMSCGNLFLEDGVEWVMIGSYDDVVIPKNSFAVKVKKKVFRARSNKNTTLKAKTLYKVTDKKGKVTYKKSKGDKKITVASNGNITVKKGLKKNRTYTVKVNVTSAATSRYEKCTRTVYVKIKVS